MKILNYTTTVSVSKTSQEIESILLKAKATAILREFNEAGSLTHISFKVNTIHGPIPYRLPANVEGVYKILYKTNVYSHKERVARIERAERVAWRIVKDWLEAQLALIQSNMADVSEIFLPYAQTSTGKTLYEVFQSGGQKMLGYSNE